MCFVPGKALILALTTLRSLVVLDVNRGGSATTVLHEASSQPVHSVAISADGELIATGGDDCVVKLWQGLLRWRGDGSLAHGGAARRAVPSSFIGHSKPITACAPSRLFRARAPANRSRDTDTPLATIAGRRQLRSTNAVSCCSQQGRTRTCSCGPSAAIMWARREPRRPPRPSPTTGLSRPPLARRCPWPWRSEPRCTIQKNVVPTRRWPCNRKNTQMFCCKCPPFFLHASSPRWLPMLTAELNAAGAKRLERICTRYL